MDIRHEERNVENVKKELQKIRNRMKSHLLRTRQDIDRRKRRAEILAMTGGSPGNPQNVLEAVLFMSCVLSVLKPWCEFDVYKLFYSFIIVPVNLSGKMDSL